MGKLIWVASYPKSGNTWLRVFINNLLRNPDQPIDINNIALLTIVDSLAEWYRRVGVPDPQKLSFEEVAKLRPKVHRLLTTHQPDNVFVKTHSALMTDFGVPAITPEVTAGAVYVVRNPLDVVLSYSHHLAKPIDVVIEHMATKNVHTGNSRDWVAEAQGSWTDNVESWTAKKQKGIHVLRYEDMTAEPVKSFKGVARFLGLDPPRARLEKAICMSSFKVLQDQERRHGFVEKHPEAPTFFRAGKVGQWREVLTPEQVARIITDHHVQMERFGYCRNGTPT
ncbi:MAG: sulfotransferase domain-containing protein [Alphaproteobacteria bacterium]|nr:sulfotransferase domain-containing protein [Alphaproteobacteria bacterium]